MEELHIPVLLSEVLKVLSPQRGESYLDLTAGYAGHASKILDVTQNYKDTVLVDRDPSAIKVLTERYSETVTIRHDNFYNAMLQEIECGNAFDMILADYGVSSPQIDQAERGFSFTKTGPLDMRMDMEQSLSADTIVNHWSEGRIVEILEKYGEEKPGRAKLLARNIVHGRPWENTTQLAEMLGRFGHGGRIHPATRVFQAIRIAVNDELSLIERSLPLMTKLLKPGGRMAIITFHSLEDRLVKEYLKDVTSHGEESELRVLTKKPITAEESEVVINPRSRSAKLRAAIKIR